MMPILRSSEMKWQMQKCTRSNTNEVKDVEQQKKKNLMKIEMRQTERRYEWVE